MGFLREGLSREVLSLVANATIEIAATLLSGNSKLSNAKLYFSEYGIRIACGNWRTGQSMGRAKTTASVWARFSNTPGSVFCMPNTHDKIMRVVLRKQ
jgi:hypothetical protein